MLNRFTPIKAAVLAGSLTLILAVGAGAATKSSISLQGPQSNLLGSHPTYTATGFAPSPATFIAIFHPASTTTCRSTFRHELAQANDYHAVHLKANKSFSADYRFKATTAGKRVLCAYLINPKSGATYAHASLRFKNHK